MASDQYLTKAQAENQARRIENYWKARGHQVQTWIEIICTTKSANTTRTYAVRSSLAGGLPVTSSRRRLVPMVVE